MIEDAANVLETLAEPTRQRIMQCVWHEELAAGQIAARFDVTFSAVSQHLKVLRDAGLVTQRKQGRQRLYRANRKTLGPLAKLLETYWQQQLNRLATLAMHEQRQTN